MSSTTSKTASPPKLIGTLVIGLNILRRQISAYPAGHPAVEGAAEKVVRLLRHILREMQSLTLAFSRDTVMWGPIPIERGNPVFHDYARALSSRGIAAITFTPAVTTKSLLNLNRTLSLRKEEIHSRGGINAVLGDLGTPGMEIQEVDYRQFRLVEGETDGRKRSGTSLWEEMVLSLFLGEDAIASAAELAANLNAYLEQNPNRRQETYATVITSFLRMTESDRTDIAAGDHGAKLAALATRLDPKLRDHFLMAAFDLLPEESAAAEDFFLALPQEVVMAAVEEVNHNNGMLPPVLLGLLEKLGGSLEEDPGPAADPERVDVAEMADTVRTLLRPEQFEHFVPEVYQGKLGSLLFDNIVCGISGEEAAALRSAYEAESLHLKTGDIILEISRLLPEDNREMSLSLGQLCIDLLDSRDLKPLLDVCKRVGRSAPAMLGQGGLPEALAGAAASCAKDRQSEMKNIFTWVGPVCVEPLLERLAHEESMAVRRFLMDCIAGIGAEARAAIVARLSDPRWFVVRNLVIILRSFNDRTDIEHLRPLLRHPQSKVRSEVLRSLLDLRDREAEKRLVADIENGAKEAQVTAINLAERTRSAEVVDALLRAVEKSRDLDVRKLAVRTLATTSDIRALPLLERLLDSRSLLRSATLDQLKMEIVRTLPSYPSRRPAQILAKVAERRDTLGQLATELLARLNERSA